MCHTYLYAISDKLKLNDIIWCVLADAIIQVIIQF